MKMTVTDIRYAAKGRADELGLEMARAIVALAMGGGALGNEAMLLPDPSWYISRLADALSDLWRLQRELDKLRAKEAVNG